MNSVNEIHRTTDRHPLNSQRRTLCKVFIQMSFACWVCVCFPAVPSGEADEPEKQTSVVEVPKPATSITAETIEQLKKKVTDATDLEEDAKKKLLETLQNSSDAVARAVRLESQRPPDQQAIEAMAVRAKELQATLATTPEKPLSGLAEDIALSDLMSALATRQPALQEAKAKLAGLEAEPARRTERRAVIARDLAGHANEKAIVEKELETVPPVDESALGTAVRQAYLQAKLREVNAQPSAWQAEILRYDAEKALDLSNLRILAAKKEAARLQNDADELNKRITAKRSRDAQYIAEQLRSFASGNAVATPYSTSAVEPFFDALTLKSDLEAASETATLAELNLQVTSQLSKANYDANIAGKTLESLRALQTRMKDKIKRVGLTGAIGLELRRNLYNLDDPRKIRNRCRIRQEEMRDLEFSRLNLEDQSPEFSERIEMLQNKSELTQEDRIALRLAQDRLVTLTTLEGNYGELFNRLGELDATEQEFIRETIEFDNFIRELVLWIRSHQLPGTEDLEEFTETSRLFFSPAHWGGVGQTIGYDVRSTAWLYLLLTAMIAILFAVQKRLRRNLSVIGEVACKRGCRTFQPTAQAALLTGVLSLAWPAIPGFISWRLLSDVAASASSRAVGHGLLAVTAGFLTLNLLRNLCSPAGLGLKHFDWPANAVRLLRLRVYGLMMVLLPLLFIENTLHSLETVQGGDSLERFIFVISLLVLAHFQFRVLNPDSGVFQDYFRRNTLGWDYRLRWPFYCLIVAVPLSLAALAIAGFYYTAYELNWRLDVITWALIGLFVMRSFLVRWFVVRHRQLRIDQARLRRQALNETAQQTTISSAPLPVVTEPAVDLQEVSDQTQRLIDSGLMLVGLIITWAVWVDVLPALGVLDQWELWPTMSEVTVDYTDSDGVQKLRTESRLHAITVADLLIAIVIGLLSFSAARNIPGLLEITLLQRLPIDAATRYAIRMVARYVISVVGMALAFNAIGIGWAKVQWLAAALTVGLGFGLQEIFANFVSGLIILFERPVRIGDVVTIADVSGTVSKIQIRATTITDWDRKEYIVPNKEFVTGRLLNWTLSDKTNRVVIDLGVAYGSDTQLARTLLLKVATNHPEVLEDPPPIATFENFGDSALNLRLRCYLPSLDNRLSTVTELHEAIDREFKSAGLEISFPQRDLHIRTTPNVVSALPVAIFPTQPESGPHENL